eukprot:2907278-Pyramimonas_sp.AAC.1
MWLVFVGSHCNRIPPPSPDSGDAALGCELAKLLGDVPEPWHVDAAPERSARVFDLQETTLLNSRCESQPRP